MRLTWALALTLSSLVGACAIGLGDEPQPGVPDSGQTNPDASADALIEPDAASPTTELRSMVAASGHHVCSLLNSGEVHCWGMNHVGQLGYGTTMYIGDDETPDTAGSVDLGGPATQVAAGDVHTCALMETGNVRCWGTGYFGRLGYGNIDDIGDDDVPSSAGDVDVGGVVNQVSGGYHHTCAVLASGAVRCWGYGRYGSLGYGNTTNIGDDETPASAGDVPVGGLVVQVAAAYWHTCVLLGTGNVRCWGWGDRGMLGYGNTENIGDNELPSSAGDVNVGAPVTQLASGYYHTCALLDTGAVRCWGRGSNGRLGYGNTDDIGDDETPADAGDVDLGGPAVQIAAGLEHTCALMQSGGVRCWGRGLNGRLGYGNTATIGDDESPASAGDVPLALGAGDDIGDSVRQLSAGHSHTCAQLRSGVRCWGYGHAGQLGRGNTDDIGDDETPADISNVPL